MWKREKKETIQHQNRPAIKLHTIIDIVAYSLGMTHTGVLIANHIREFCFSYG